MNVEVIEGTALVEASSSSGLYDFMEQRQNIFWQDLSVPI